jgi:predicted dehydrogenase
VEVIGTEGGAKYSTKEPKTLWTFRRDGDQLWCRTELGHQMAFPTVTGGIFEAGFPDCFLQMCAAFAAERAGMLGDRLRCVTPEDAVLSHQVFAAALRSHARRQVVEIPAREQDRHGIALDAAVEGGR